MYSYDVFGEPNRTSGVGNPYMFTGRRLDAETNLYYYRARYYSPYTGRFLQADPIGYLSGLNLYTYTGNNPINWVDPSGEFSLGRGNNRYQTCVRACKTTRNKRLAMAEKAHDYAKAAAEADRNACHNFCDWLAPPGCPEEDPLDRNEACKALCDAWYAYCLTVYFLTYESARSAIWQNYAICRTGCLIFLL